MPIYGSHHIVLLRSRFIMWRGEPSVEVPRYPPLVWEGILPTSRKRGRDLSAFAVNVTFNGWTVEGAPSAWVSCGANHSHTQLIESKTEVLALLLSSWLSADILLSWCLEVWEKDWKLQWKRLCHWCKQCKQWPKITAPLPRLMHGSTRSYPVMLALFRRDIHFLRAIIYQT